MALDETEFIWFDGKLVPWHDAKIHVLTHALHYGTGYFEGIRAYKCQDGTSSVFRLHEHMARFLNSAKILSLPCPFDLETLKKAVMDTLKANKMAEGYIRPLSFVGYGNMGVHPGTNPMQTIIATWPWGAYLGAEALEKGVRVKTSSFNRMHPNTHMGKAKASGNYVNSVLAKMEVVADGYDEALMLDVNGFVAEASGENIFIISNGVIKTTPLTSILGGIKRATVMTLAQDLGYTVVEALFSRDELYCADEMFFTGTAAEVTPVREVDRRSIGTGSVGPITKAIQKSFFETVRGGNTKYPEWIHTYTV